MKTNLFFSTLIIGIVLLTGCINEQSSIEYNLPNESLSLMAPNGDLITTSMKALNDETAMIIASQFGDDFPFEITSIEYATPSDGYLAIINYRLADGRISNFAKSNSAEVINNSNVDLLYWDIDIDTNNIQFDDKDGTLTAQTREAPNTNEIIRPTNTSYKCNSASQCTPCQVKIAIRYTDLDKPVTTISCSDKCSDCKLTATIL